MASVSGGTFDGASNKVQAGFVSSLKPALSATIGQQLAAAASQHPLGAGGTAGSITFAGTSAGTSDKIVATQTTHESGVTLNFKDGSSLTILGTSTLGHFFGH